MPTSLQCLAILSVLMCAVLPASPSMAQEAPPSAVSWKADARLGYFGARTHDRNGSTIPRRDVIASRLRFGAEARVTDRLRAGARIAGRFGTGQNGLDVHLRDHAPSAGGLLLGQVSFDELYLDYRPADRLSLRVGRMQTRADRMGLVGKSLDRKDSGNTGVTWTDGARLLYAAPGGWTADLIVQHNPEEGPTNVARPPLSFADPRSRVTIYAAAGTRERWGPVVQRGVAVTYMPGAMPVDSAEAGPARDYIGVVGRAALGWGPRAGGRRFVVAGEVGYAPATPSASLVGLGSGDSGQTGGLAVQANGTVYDIAPGHNVGGVYGRTDPGWLISPDYRHNSHLVEGRYQWRITASHSIESRLRWRRDLRELSGAERAREDVDVYFRLSMTF